MYRETAQQLITFIKKSPTAFHVVETVREELCQKGFQALTEGEAWKLQPGGKYYVTRNGSSILAFQVGEELENYSFQITASHSDSPCFKLKEHAQITVKDQYTVLDTEGYGGMLCATWFDRPLSIAGRVIVRDKEQFRTKLLKIDRDLLMIPSLAIHMNREANEKLSFNKQKDLLPILGGKALEKEALKELIATELQVEREDIYGTELFLYNRTQPSVWGMEQEFVSAPQLDDLQCAYATLRGFLAGAHPETISVYACFDNEEVGSGTKQGAASTFLFDVLGRINRALGRSEEDYQRALASSLMLSCDNAHALHPNYTEKSDVNHAVYMNEGIVVKAHAGQKYTSDAISTALFRGICEKAGVPLQYFANRSDMPGGSTLGNIAMTQVSLNTIDIGLPQLAMHSAYETAGVKDTSYLIRAVEAFYQSKVQETTAGTYRVTTHA